MSYVIVKKLLLIHMILLSIESGFCQEASASKGSGVQTNSKQNHRRPPVDMQGGGSGISDLTRDISVYALFIKYVTRFSGGIRSRSEWHLSMSCRQTDLNTARSNVRPNTNDVS